MKIVHWAPFAPNRCGLYEAARDCARADYMRGHKVLFVDTGVSSAPGVREDPRVDAMDHRGGWLLRTVAAEKAYDADLWVCHDGVSDTHSAKCQVPMVWMIHGRPLACFRPEQNGRPGTPYSVLPTLAGWPRVKAMVTMWDEFVPYWGPVLGDKLRCTSNPPIDVNRYGKGDPRPLDPEKVGRWNVLIADSWRSDIDIYETAMACYHAAVKKPGVKVHFWAVEQDRQGPWQHVWKALDEIGALGEIHPRETDIDGVYMAMDCLVTPHHIGVRTIGEALTVGLPVVAGLGCRYTEYQAQPHDAHGVANEIVRCLEDPHASEKAVAQSFAFGLGKFGERMETIYEEALGLVPA